MSLRKRSLILLLFFILIIGGTIALAFGHGNDSIAFDYSTTAIDKVRAAEKQGTTIELQEKDINSILGVYIGKGRSRGNITIKGINLNVSENSLSMKIPVEYKGLDLLLSTGGKSTYLQNENIIEFTPSFYKVGNLPIPKKLVETFMKKNAFKGVEFVDASIRISASTIPFSIKNMTFKPNSIELALSKIDNLAGLFKKIKPGEIITPAVTNGTISEVPKIEDPKGASTSPAAKPNVDTKNSLSEVNNQLSVATSTLQTSKEKQILQRIMATISAVSSNPNYNYTSDVNQVTAIYTSLTKEERTRVKIAIISNVDINAAIKLKNTFGI